MPAQYIQRLPAVFQTVTEKKFFDATFDQVFQKKESELLSGFLGRRNPGKYNPITDFYLPEPSKNRTWWQLEATAYARDADTNRTNIFFYEDLLDNIEYYEGNTLNQDRLFESQYYSFGPPIDYDMFINYQNYYWIDQGLPVIEISGVMGSDIIGQSSYTTPPTADPPNLTLMAGMNISLLDDPAFVEPHIVENFGGCNPEGIVTESGTGFGIDLIEPASDLTAGTVFEFLPWDGIIETTSGRLIDNRLWDATTWVIQAQPGTGNDYITIERGALDNNAWSRTNKWYHISTINETIKITGGSFPSNAARALRPIIQFVANIPLYKSGTQFKAAINFGFGTNEIGQAFTKAQFQGNTVAFILANFGIEISNQDLIVWMKDTATTPGVGINNRFIWTANVDPTTNIVTFPTFDPVEEGDIFIATENAPVPGFSAQTGQSWYFSNNVWQEVHNEKISTNQAPLFELVDHNNIPLDDPIIYPQSSFRGNEIFSYKINETPGATVDPVLGFPIVYSSAGQSSDIIFQNDLITDRYIYGPELTPIDGYYYHHITTNNILYNSWNLYDICDCDDIIPPPPANCIEVSKQRVIDKFVVGYGVEFQFRLSVTPYGYEWGGGPIQPLADIIVSVNGIEVKNDFSGFTFFELNNRIYIDLETYLTNLLLIPQAIAPVVEAQTYTHELLNPEYPGYFEIPQQLEANPTQLEISEFSISQIIQHFSSIISNQIGFEGIAFGGINNYLDSRKNRSVGSYILQNLAPTLKSMLVSSSDDLDFIKGIRFSADEYTKFKNRFLSVAQQLINQGFSALQVHNNTVDISAWVGEILRRLNVSKEFSNAFAYSYMVAQGTPTFSESIIVPPDGLYELTNSINLTDPKNTIYFYDISDSTDEHILVAGIDYNIISTNPITVQFNTETVPGYESAPGAFSTGLDVTVNSTVGLSPGMVVKVKEGSGSGEFEPNTRVVSVAIDGTHFTISQVPINSLTGGATVVEAGKIILATLYQNPLPTYIPSTPTKVGAWGAYVPRKELDTSYAIPTDVIIGHDGSKTIAYNDYRDDLLLDLEKRIYNGLQQKYRNEYFIPLRLESVKPGFFRKTRYSRDEYLEVTESYLNKWSAKNKANYRVNDWLTASQPPTPTTEFWKLYNYTDAIIGITSPDPSRPYILPGNWKGIFQYYYDTYYPDTRPWEMLGFSEEPEWWESEYGTDWSDSNTDLWDDLEAGIIRQGPSAIYDPDTLEAQPQEMWARPGLSLIIPVNAAGVIRSVPDIFNINIVEDDDPFDHFDDPWVYGDGGPVEQAWMSTSGYAYSAMEFLYLMRPGPFGELLWDTLGTELSPGRIDPTDPNSPMSSKNWQYVQNDRYKFELDPFTHESDPFFSWMRPKNKDQIVHAELIDGVPQIRFGYQNWISDRILFLGKNVGDTFGQKVRTLDVNLANKLAGFINKDTTNTYISSVTPGANTNTLIIPTNNFEVILHKSPIVDTYSYSGIIIRALEDGTFVIYGYDLLDAEFITLDRRNDKLIDISVGGTPAEFRYFEIGATYKEGDIVRYNGVYYTSKGIQTVSKFTPATWNKLKALPSIGGVSVTYRPVSDVTITRYPYGSIIKTVQEVFDIMIGWGAYLEQQGWQFKDVSPDTNEISDWLSSAKQFLFWINTNWAPNASIQLSPLSNSATLIVKRGYPNDVEMLSNGVYSILDKYGVAIPPNGTTTDRDGALITVAPADLTVGGIYYLQINASETEHVIIFDNSTSFGDIIYDPLYRARQQRLRFNGFRSLGWYGKMEAPGYLVIEDQLVPNYDTIVDAMRYYYDANVTIDNPSLEDLGRNLIGYESKSYLDNLEVANDVQYLFYQGVIRQKGTKQAFEKLFRSTKVQGNEIIKVYEEWALRLGDFGNTVEQVSTEFRLIPEQNTGEVVVARLNFVPSEIGFVKQINIFNAENIYTTVPKIVISEPDATPLIVWSNFNSLATYGIGDIVKFVGSDGVPVFYSKKINSGPGPFIPEEWDVFLLLRVAKAYVVLDANGRIARVDISDPGFGYLVAPTVTIESTESHDLDRLYAVWQGGILRDPTLDNIINIDIDDTEKWVVRPTEPSVALEFPLTDKIEYNPIPTAGYVHFNDVDFSIFSDVELTAAWGTPSFNPINENTIWIAKTFTEDWGVYKMVDISDDSDFDIIVGDGDELFLRTLKPYLITPQFGGGDPNSETDYGNILSLYVKEARAEVTVITKRALGHPDVSGGIITTIVVDDGGSGYEDPPAITINPIGGGSGAILEANLDENGKVISVNIVNGGAGYVSPTITFADPLPYAGAIKEITVTKTGANYLVPPVVTITGTGTGATAIATIAGGKISEIIITNPGIGYTAASVTIADPLAINPGTNFAIPFTFNQVETDNDLDQTHNYYSLITLDGNPILSTDLPDYINFTNLLLFKTMRFLTKAESIVDWVDVGNKIWVDGIDLDPPVWNVFKDGEPFRTQEKLINTSLFESATVFNDEGTQLVQLPIYDPFKFILPGSAKQNISYISLRDPARYNVTGDVRLFSENITFDEDQIGKLWWDLSNTRYVYYEQPIAKDDSETEVDNLVYRRDHWAQLFPGSIVAIYEWVKSPVPPAEYTGSGIPRDVTSYVQISTSNRFTSITETNYYFWVRGTIDMPNIKNRTMAAVDVARLLQNPKGQGFTFFSPIQQTETNNSYMFSNVQEILAYQGDNIQVQYRLSEREDQEHTQWALFREGDPNSIVTDQFWNKMVDSLTGYTDELPISDEWENGIIIPPVQPIPPVDPPLEPTTEVLPVPDPTLSEREKYGIKYRPRQSMFVKIQEARKIFVQAANELLKHIPIRDNNPDWNINVDTNEFWTYTNWYELGFEDAVPTVVFQTLTQANLALISGQLMKDTILQVLDGTIDGRYILYVVIQPNPNIPVLSLNEIGIENSSIKILDTMYTIINRYELSVELRQLLNAFRTEVMINEFIVDQNELFFSMVNYVLSEQKTPDWVFKTSYIFIKEDNIPLTQSQLFIPDQIGNIVDYIKDVKPYHTQIRDYTSSHHTMDIAIGSVLEKVVSILTEGTPWDEDGIHPWDESLVPVGNTGGIDPWDHTFLIEEIELFNNFPQE